MLIIMMIITQAVLKMAVLRWDLPPFVHDRAFWPCRKITVKITPQYPSKWEERAESARSDDGPEMQCLYEG
ncbi:MAG: hypothetical protein JWO78_1061 [Micavibrio sp.]|nr:hypothetical protein [Micavibrio sp.]